MWGRHFLNCRVGVFEGVYVLEGCQWRKSPASGHVHRESAGALKEPENPCGTKGKIFVISKCLGVVRFLFFLESLWRFLLYLRAVGTQVEQG